MQPEMSITLRFRLALLCVEFESPGSDMVATLAEMVKIAAAERLTLDSFTKRDRIELVHAVTATGIALHPDTFPPGSLGGRAYAAADLWPVP